MGLDPDGVDGEREDDMTKVAFCFPGQGSLEEGMGREIALRPDAQLHHEQFDLMAIG